MSEDRPTLPEAMDVLRHEAERIDNVFPWWQKLRAPLIMIGLAMAGMVMAVVMLVRIVDRANERAADRDDRLDCRNLYSSRIANAQQDAIRWSTTMQTDFNTALLQISQKIPADPTTLQRGISAANDASVAWAQALEDRNAWDNAGAPLPCPITSESVTLASTTTLGT